jgi:hypothetical protein
MTSNELKVVKLSSGEQIVCYLTHEKGSIFIRMIEPMELKIHSNLNDYGAVDETVCLTDWIHHAADNVFSIHKDRIVTISKPDENLIEYYDSTKKKYDRMKRDREKERKEENSLRLLEDKFKNGDTKLTKKELYDILAGKITKH